MGSGASRRLHIVQAQANVTQKQRLSHDWKHENNKETSYQENIEWDVSHTDTLTRYKMNYPKQAEDFQTMFENIQLLRNTMNNSSTRMIGIRVRCSKYFFT